MHLKQCSKNSRIKPIILNWFSLNILFAAHSKAAQQYIYIHIHIYIYIYIYIYTYTSILNTIEPKFLAPKKISSPQSPVFCSNPAWSPVFGLDFFFVSVSISFSSPARRCCVRWGLRKVSAHAPHSVMSVPFFNLFLCFFCFFFEVTILFLIKQR